MNKTGIDNRGIPPLAGVCSYEEAFKAGYSVDRCVDLLKRYHYIKKNLNLIMAAHLARTPEWEVKCALGYHLWLEAEHCSMIRKRVTEMREPPLHLDSVPDEGLERLLDETIRANDTVELLTGIYRIIRPELIRCLQTHLNQTNPLADQPTCRILRIILTEEREMYSWGETATKALLANDENLRKSTQWSDHLTAYLNHAGGISGDLFQGEGLGSLSDLPLPRADGQRYIMDAVPQRDDRFQDNYNRSAKVDEYYQDDSLSSVERVYALMYKRLREMDVPEWMAPVIYKTEEKPWEYYYDLSRQVWDEIRHAMLGEVGLAERGIPFYKYPLELKSSMIMNTELQPIEAHLILWAIEQGLMPKKTGKQWEWEIAVSSQIPMAINVQDYDWADEVLHAQIGRKWLMPVYGGVLEASKAGEEMIKRWRAGQTKMLALSDQHEWWPQFISEVFADMAKDSKSG